MNRTILEEDVKPITDLMCKINGFDPEMTATEKSHKTKNWKSDLRKGNWKHVKYFGYVELYFYQKENNDYEEKIKGEYYEERLELARIILDQQRMKNELNEKIYDVNQERNKLGL